MTHTIFFRLFAEDNKEERLAAAVAAARDGSRLASVTHTVDPSSFAQIPGSPFAYWVSERVRRLFRELPPFEAEGRTVRQGLATADDFRFVRAWWEVPPEKIVTGTAATTPEEFRQQTFEGKRWVPFAKGGSYSPYYADLHLVVNWERDGEEMRAFANSVIRNPDFYFRPGLTWPRRTQGGFNVRCYPAGAIFADKGPAAFLQKAELIPTLALMNSVTFRGLISLRMTFGSYEVGVVQRTAVPPAESYVGFKDLGVRSVELAASLEEFDETTHYFHLPPALRFKGATIAERARAWQEGVTRISEELKDVQGDIDKASVTAYGIDEADREGLELAIIENQQRAKENGDEVDTDEEEQETSDAGASCELMTRDLISYCLGCAFGRWDVREARADGTMSRTQDRFSPVPVRSRGMMRGLEPGYPLRVDLNGILADDAGPEGSSAHQDDIVRRVGEVLELTWHEQAEAIEKEACEILGVKSLREYFRNPRGFLEYHIKRYSKSRRKAPIYWLLQSEKRSYGLWLYYHRLNKDTLFKAVEYYVEPKIRGEAARLKELTERLEAGKEALSRRERSALEKAIDAKHDLLAELGKFKAALEAVAAIPYDPDLNDGVVLNIAPLREVVPWKEARKYWDELVAGKYAWSTMSQRLRAKGLVKG